MAKTAYSHPKETKIIAVAGQLIKTNPFRFRRFEEQYRHVSELSLKYFKTRYKPVYLPKINYYFGEDVESLFLKASKEAEVVTGFIYSNEASHAALLAEEKKTIYLSPVSPLEEVYKGRYSKGMGLRADVQLKILQKFSSSVHESSPKFETIMLYPTTNVVNNIHAENFRKTFKLDQEIKFNESVPKLNNLKFSQKNVNVLLAGYAYELVDSIRYLLKVYPQIQFTFIGTHQWAYCSDVIQRSLADVSVNLFIISELIEHFDRNVEFVHPESKKSREEYLSIRSSSPLGKLIDPIEYSMFDATLLALTILNDPDINSAELFSKKLENFKFYGSAGEYSFEKGQIVRPTYLSKWTGAYFRPQRKID